MKSKEVADKVAEIIKTKINVYHNTLDKELKIVTDRAYSIDTFQRGKDWGVKINTSRDTYKMLYSVLENQELSRGGAIRVELSHIVTAVLKSKNTHYFENIGCGTLEII